jgi:hypothetical protein
LAYRPSKSAKQEGPSDTLQRRLCDDSEGVPNWGKGKRRLSVRTNEEVIRKIGWRLHITPYVCSMSRMLRHGRSWRNCNTTRGINAIDSHQELEYSVSWWGRGATNVRSSSGSIPPWHQRDSEDHKKNIRLCTVHWQTSHFIFRFLIVFSYFWCFMVS